MDALTAWLSSINDWIYGWFLISLLVGAGSYFTIRSRGLQFRHFGRMFGVLKGSRRSADHDGGISAFQAFAVGLAARVGTGNIAGVAVAITTGGAGSIFWMWLVAIIGMATAFIEAVLAQIFKMPWRDGTFRGGPAFYIWRGLKSWKWGAAFAVALLFTYGIAFEMVQANTVAVTVEQYYSVPIWLTALIITAFAAVAIFGGVRSVAKVTEWMAPGMAVLYVAISLLVLAVNYDQIGTVFSTIFASAFGFQQAASGITGGIIAALLNGVKRGLYSNEAGMGSAPNAASTATTIHPVRQGLIQSFGVFVDTVVVCTATAFIILSSGVYQEGQEVESSTLTAASAVNSLGSWVLPIMVALIVVFAFSTIIGNYAYAEVNLDYLTANKTALFVLKIITLGSIFVGALAEIKFVWTFADTSMFFMTAINLVAILLLGKWAFGALKDFEANPEGHFVAKDNPYLPGKLESEIWTEEGVAGASK
ncbi:alanine/glycine:cation symporter family protein [Arcanobacterium hippocoleae]|uniref:AGCS family alanine or glycine:cation symporter n=1 Tax=Arcanobacterium hippocoleae TaxID=149017 RepID=A0ABU1SZJ8_9ACTO|nr:sodium:alanine symporter family protein [Arcanobacterium hippocoleae]MDR6938567.1 AGCS family alanine or glycine:cation symporter [Arcanobacterium hippocoleae]